MGTMKQIHFRYIVLSSMHLTEIREDLFWAPHPIESVAFVNVNIDNLNKKFLRPLLYNLTNVIMDWLPNDLNLNDIFDLQDNNKNWNWIINFIYIRSRSPKFRVLAANNFSYLPMLISLNLAHCGVEIIEANTFDFISSTLQNLHLNNNKMMFIEPNMFYKIVDTMHYKTELYINFKHNLFECNCDVFEIGAIFNVAFILSGNKHSDTFDTLCNYSLDTIRYELTKCTNLVPLHNRCAYDFSKQRLPLMYSKFTLKIDKNLQTLIIKSPKRRKFRLWAHNLIDVIELDSKWGLTHKKCPVGFYLSNQVTCQLFYTSTESISLKNIIKNVGPTQICIIHIIIGPKTIWPLHCIISYHPSGNNNVDNINSTIIIISIFAGLINAILIIKMCWIREREKMPEQLHNGLRHNKPESNYYESINIYKADYYLNLET